MKFKIKNILKLGWLFIVSIAVLSFPACSKTKTGVNSLVFKDEEILVPYGQEINAEDFISEGIYDTILTDPSILFDLGPQKIRLIVFYQGKRSEKTIKVTSVDRTPPTITKLTEGIAVNVGDKIDVAKYFVAVDEIDGDVEVVLKEPIDTSKSGTVEIAVFAVDLSGNEATESSTVVINEVVKPKEVGKNSGNNSGNKNSGNSSGNNNGSSKQSKKPKIVGVKNITLKIGTSIADLKKALLPKSVKCNVKCKISVNFAEVNTGVPKTYTAYYTSSVGAKASCKVTITK